jgi:hypothetical protein
LCHAARFSNRNFHSFPPNQDRHRRFRCSS